MKIHQVKAKPSSYQKRRRLGRGISAGQGASCGKGMRGQKARSGAGPRPGFEGGQQPLYRRLPKLKYFPKVNSKEYMAVNVGHLATFESHAEVTPQTLQEAGIIHQIKAPVKILGDGELNVPLTVKAAAFSRSARAKIEAAGGRCEIEGQS
ncbi:50S ribosomal protein L15 [Geitlerinema sp. PCC 9228]|jgi:large subunit ribosomal protein L15|uniref:50S ribosomal protein L15 n=1 Tax=Geitlerinema sp. PCC 9228 TaxID=111611 RepID=UPI0008F9BEBE|nr:50S ribosomal protein L15 [Geitlerinema sp. PCC 9228]